MSKVIAGVPVLPSRDLDRSTQFYLALGFEVRRAFPDYVIMGSGGSELHLARMEHDPARNPAGLYLRVEGIDHFAALFGKTADLKPWGQKEFAISDPDENLVRLGEAMPG